VLRVMPLSFRKSRVCRPPRAASGARACRLAPRPSSHLRHRAARCRQDGNASTGLPTSSRLPTSATQVNRYGVRGRRVVQKLGAAHLALWIHRRILAGLAAAGADAAGLERETIVGTLPSSPTLAPSMVGRERRHRHHVQVARRGLLLGTGAAIAGAALAAPGLVSADSDHDGDLFRPDPQPLPRPIPGVLAPPPFDYHVFGPGPTSVTLPLSGGQLQGLDVDPSVITDFKGFTALAYPVGKARGSDGVLYDHEGDMRLFSGRYLPADGSRERKGTFALV
jgi:hypothetical protein